MDNEAFRAHWKIHWKRILKDHGLDVEKEKEEVSSDDLF